MHNVKHSEREKDALKNNEDLNVVIDSVSVCFSYMVLFDVSNHTFFISKKIYFFKNCI